MFVADFMWRSALGMPVGIMGRGADRAYAPASPSEEYVKIPGEALRPKDGEYVLQVTEELWEIAYLDELKLLVVDHPASVDVFVDERFVPPAPVALRLYQVEKRGRPVAALDHLGRDALPALAEADFDYVADFRPGPYQGITELHDLVLDLGEVRPGEAIKLFLRGWVHPTDASINVAMSQSDAVGVVPLHLQVAEPGGGWRTVIDDLGVPSGKNKIMVTDLTGLLPEFDRRVRIRTNLEVYWDEAFVSVGEPSASLVTTTLSARSADLHERGLSRLYRRGGRFGPHWFDYEDVVGESPWRPLAGPFTRYGDVAPLLEEGDGPLRGPGPRGRGDHTVRHRRGPTVVAGVAARLPALLRRLGQGRGLEHGARRTAAIRSRSGRCRGTRTAPTSRTPPAKSIESTWNATIRVPVSWKAGLTPAQPPDTRLPGRDLCDRFVQRLQAGGRHRQLPAHVRAVLLPHRACVQVVEHTPQRIDGRVGDDEPHELSRHQYLGL